ncbi:hypothetical protein B0H10DRAFT_1849475 [Mycena sp. CBHHK59/15]|nr:hypothetical protein B0H10DRAFT_1849475 [Mycena sp. CBHHK59/15]
MLDLLDTLPKLRLSNDHLKAIIWVMKECGTANVLSFYALRKMQAKLTKDVGLKPQHHTSALGNQFYMNHPNDLIRLDFANPLVRDLIHFYPEITSTISESWQAAKYVNKVALDDLSPMWADWSSSPYRHFYIKELAQCRNGNFAMPFKWVIFRGSVHAESYSVIREQSGIFTIEGHQVIRVPAADLRFNALDLAEHMWFYSFMSWFTEARNIFTPYITHPVRAIALGRPVFVLRIMPWADDVSGNQSKQYNAHMNMYIANINLPHKKLSQEYFVRFCCTSPHASSLEQFDALAIDCNQVIWNPAYDCGLKCEILFQVHAHLLPANNPQQAESTSTAGSSSTWCRINLADDLQKQTVTPRTPEETILDIKKQIKAACLGVATAVEKLQTETGVKDKISVHWINQLIEKARDVQKERIYDRDTRDPRLNDNRIKGEEQAEIRQDLITKIQDKLYTWVIMQPTDRYEKLTPESRNILHTILLGEDKYVWHETNKGWNDEQDALFAARLQSSSAKGLSIPPLRAQYLVQYKNSLIGKHFKSLQQLAVFHLDEKLCSPQVFDLWKANGELGAMLWYPEIKDMDTYLSDLQIVIDNVLDHWAIIDPTWIINKFKLHVLPHTPEHIRRFGPAVLFSTEVFECWNAVFRLCSVLSNHQAPSLDIAVTLADMERFKHQVSGGWWCPEGGDWIQAGPKVRDFLTSNPQLQCRLGWAGESSFKTGTAKLLSKAKRNPLTWKATLGAHWSESIDHHGEGKNWNCCKHVVSISEDPCLPGSWIFFRSEPVEGQPLTMVGINLIFFSAPLLILSTSGSITVVEHFNISATKDPRMNMPLLLRSGRIFLVSAKHDCRHCKCPFIEVAGPCQERHALTLKRKAVNHSEDNCYHLNMHALHNAHLIQEALPRHLTEPKPCFVDRRAKHSEFAAVLREIGPAKRQETATKVKVTKQKTNRIKQTSLWGCRSGGMLRCNLILFLLDESLIHYRTHEYPTI